MPHYVGAVVLDYDTSGDAGGTSIYCHNYTFPIDYKHNNIEK